MSELKTVNIYGHNIELYNLEPGEHATDIIILTRTVHHDEDGDLQDALKCVSSTNTTALIRAGMATMAAQMETNAWKTEGEE